jgi:hypothetical protein
MSSAIAFIFVRNAPAPCFEDAKLWYLMEQEIELAQTRKFKCGCKLEAVWSY